MDAYERALAYATDRGTADGTAAAGWYEIPDGSRSRYDAAALRAILTGLEDGDPAVLDTLPYPDLSGQWADSLTGPQLVADAIVHADDWTMTRAEWVAYWPEHDALAADICDAYESAFTGAVLDEITRRIRYQLGLDR